MTITTIIEWDMGHRIPNHKSKCKNLHGHRYKLEINVEGRIIRKTKNSSESMVMDFGDVKQIARQEIEDVCDHSFMFWKKDVDVAAFFRQHPHYKHIAVPFIPTAEEMAKWIFTILDVRIKNVYKTGLQLHSVIVWETPTTKAMFTREEKNAN